MCCYATSSSFVQYGSYFSDQSQRQWKKERSEKRQINTVFVFVRKIQKTDHLVVEEGRIGVEHRIEISGHRLDRAHGGNDIIAHVAQGLDQVRPFADRRDFIRLRSAAPP